MNINDNIKSIPEKPGVYLMKSEDNSILYIGKAKNLKKRVSSYFHKKIQNVKTENLISNTASIETIITDNEVEALILESNLIKKYKPKYNIELKENESYPYIKISKETYPRIVKTRIKLDNSALYFGPYTNVKYINRTIRTITDLFPIRRCKVNLDQHKSNTPCMNYHLGKCASPCSGKITKDAYNSIVHQVILFLKGQNTTLLRHIKNEMKKEAKNKRYEQAIQLRERYEALKHLLEEQKITTNPAENEDIIGISHEGGMYTFTVLVKRNGKIIGKRDYTVKNGASSCEVLEQFLSLYYDHTVDFPGKIILPFEIKAMQVIQKYFSEKYNKKVYIIVPKRGTKKKLVDMACKNAYQKNREESFLPDPLYAVKTLKRVLELKNDPRCIEAFDIATIMGKFSVAGMVRFSNGVPDKKNYRKFKIKYVEEQNDIEMIKEAVARRYQRMVNEKQPFPDLILVDGGKLQVKGARGVLDDLGLSNIPVIGLAKKHEDIYMYNKQAPLQLEKRNEALRLLMAMRDEVHRFANTYHVNLRTKEIIQSRLKIIPGIGERLIVTILSSIETSEKPITMNDLKSIKGIGSKKAMEVYRALKETNGIVK